MSTYQVKIVLSHYVANHFSNYIYSSETLEVIANNKKEAENHEKVQNYLKQYPDWRTILIYASVYEPNSQPIIDSYDGYYYDSDSEDSDE
jgi:ABC-type sulfate transport system substrate-binding protein